MHFVDGKASFVVGTHTHVPTADATLCGVAVETGDPARAIFPVRNGGWLRTFEPDFWLD